MTLEEALAQIEELKKQNDALKGDVEKQKGIVENAEKKFKEHANELGELRKQKKASDESVEALKRDIEELKRAGGGSGGQGTKKDDEKEATADEVEASLSAEQKKAVEAVYMQLTDEQKLKFHSDERYRKGFLLEAQSRLKSVPQDPWKKPAKKERAEDSDVKTLFDRALKRERFVPPGGSGSAARSGGGSEEPKRISLHGGSDFLGGLKRLREESGALA